MKDRGLIFTAESVKAILAGTKTQTRRLFAKRDLAKLSPLATFHHVDNFGNALFTDNTCIRVMEVGQRVYAKESWRPCMEGWRSYVEYGGPSLPEHAIPDSKDGLSRDDFLKLKTFACRFHGAKKGLHSEAWKSPMFMPRWASRLTLEITAVRVERLQAITEQDCIAEGAPLARIQHMRDPTRGPIIDGFANAWDAMHGKANPWSSNPFVMVYDFKRVEG